MEFVPQPEHDSECDPPRPKQTCVVRHVMAKPAASESEKIENRVQLINQRKRPGRNARCPNHKEHKFKRCPHGCAREPRAVLGKVVQKIVTD